MEHRKGHFVISLDFELFWGMFDKVTIGEYGDRILGERTAIPRMLELFDQYNIHATWATVGMLMVENKEELLSSLPSEEVRPVYDDMRISAYHHIEHSSIQNTESEDKYHFGHSLVLAILKTPHQEIGNHTFSHYYCIDGCENDPKKFAADIDAFNYAARRYDIHATSIVFPRNQMNTEVLITCAQKGITAYRGNENHFLYHPRKESEQSLFIRGLRLLDHYVNISGYHTYPIPKNENGLPVNIPASRFLRPWSKKFALFEPLRMKRIKNAMTHAAKNGEVFHLWWHPHNFGIDQDMNFKNLSNILEHYRQLNARYGMQSASMHEIALKTR